MTTVNTPQILTTDDVAALRKADSVTFHYFRGAGVIRAHLRGGYSNPPRIYTAREQRMFPNTDSYSADRMREISVQTVLSGYASGGETAWRMTDSGSSHTGGADSNPAAFHMEHSGQYSPTWQTIARAIHSGDRIRLTWTADNNNETFRLASLHADELHLIIMRADAKPHATFLVDHSVTPDNSARMIQRYGSSR